MYSMEGVKVKGGVGVCVYVEKSDNIYKLQQAGL